MLCFVIEFAIHWNDGAMLGAAQACALRTVLVMGAFSSGCVETKWGSEQRKLVLVSGDENLEN